MPQLPGKVAAAAREAAANSGFTPIDEGTYELRLTNVTAKQSSNDNPMWVWELETTGRMMVDGELVEAGPTGRRQWVNSVLTEKAMWKVGEMFAAFGVDTDTDTDELIGECCLGEVVQRVIGAGARAGQTGNEVQRCIALPGVEAPSSGGQKVAAGSAAEGDGGW